MKLVEFKQLPENIVDYKMFQEDLIRPEKYSSLKQYILNRFKNLNTVYFSMRKLEDNREAVSFYALKSDLKELKESVKEKLSK